MYKESKKNANKSMMIADKFPGMGSKGGIDSKEKGDTG